MKSVVKTKKRKREDETDSVRVCQAYSCKPCLYGGYIAGGYARFGYSFNHWVSKCTDDSVFDRKMDQAIARFLKQKNAEQHYKQQNPVSEPAGTASSAIVPAAGTPSIADDYTSKAPQINRDLRAPAYNSRVRLMQAVLLGADPDERVLFAKMALEKVNACD